MSEVPPQARVDAVRASRVFFIGHTRDWIGPVVASLGSPADDITHYDDAPMSDRMAALLKSTHIVVVEHLCDETHKPLLELALASGLPTALLREGSDEQADGVLCTDGTPRGAAVMVVAFILAVAGLLDEVSP